MSVFYEMVKQGGSHSEPWSGEHWGHPKHKDQDYHPSGSLSNSVSHGGANGTVYYEGKLSATKNTTTSSSCSCCNEEGLSGYGTFTTHSSTVFIHGENAVRSCDSAFSYDHRPICSPSGRGTVFIGS